MISVTMIGEVLAASEEGDLVVVSIGEGGGLYGGESVTVWDGDRRIGWLHVVGAGESVAWGHMRRKGLKVRIATP